MSLQKHKQGKAPVVDGNLQAARIVTHKTIREIKEDGSQVVKRVLVPLETPRPMSVDKPIFQDMPMGPIDEENPVCASPPAMPRRHLVGIPSSYVCHS
jgi:hypothetical protein